MKTRTFTRGRKFRIHRRGWVVCSNDFVFVCHNTIMHPFFLTNKNANMNSQKGELFCNFDSKVTSSTRCSKPSQTWYIMPTSCRPKPRRAQEIIQPCHETQKQNSNVLAISTCVSDCFTLVQNSNEKRKTVCLTLWCLLWWLLFESWLLSGFLLFFTEPFWVSLLGIATGIFKNSPHFTFTSVLRRKAHISTVCELTKKFREILGCMSSCQHGQHRTRQDRLVKTCQRLRAGQKLPFRTGKSRRFSIFVNERFAHFIYLFISALSLSSVSVITSWAKTERV